MKAKTKKNVIKKASAIVAAAALMMTAGGGTLAAFADTNVFANPDPTPGKWYVDFETFEDERDYAAEFSKELMAEGAVLMKNNNNFLPLRGTENITLFGARSYNPVKGGTGSGGSYKTDPRMVNLPQGLENAGFHLNQTVANVYGAGADNEMDPAILQAATGSYLFYNDAAIVTFGRTSGESADLAKFNVRGHKDKTEHSLELDDNEKALLEHVEEHFDNVIVIVNTTAVLEIGDLVKDPKIKAILWIGMPGHFGLDAIGKLLNGETNPSGALVDFWMEDLKHDPTWSNHGTNQQNNTYDPVTGKVVADTTTYDNKAYDADGKAIDGTAVIEYEEGIYLGYKYYETVYAEIVKGSIGYDVQNDALYTVTEQKPAADNKQQNADDYWADEVVYPFGYGMSYTTFSQELLTSASDIKSAIEAKNGLDDTFTVQVKVTNTGDVAGKHIVQLYETAPYTKGGIEKAEVSLVSFEKSNLLLSGESQTLDLEVRIGDLASFDYNNKSTKFGAGNGGYILEAGDYTFSVRDGSHKVLDSEKVTGLTEKVWNKNGDPTNIFSKGDDFDSLYNQKAGGDMTILSRADMVGTFPTAAAKEGKKFNKKLATLLQGSNVAAGTKETADNYRNETRYTSYYNSSDDKETDPWYQVAVAEFTKYANDPKATWTQAKTDADGKVIGRPDPVLVTSYGTVSMCGWEGQMPHDSYVQYTEIQLYQMAGIDFESDEVLDGNKIPLAKEGGKFYGLTGRQAWAVFMNQLTWDEIKAFISDGSYKTQELLAVGKEESMDADGPAVMNPDGTFWPCEATISSTWNTELAHKQGILIGNESLFQDVPGWYGSGMNVHRSPFSGRNFEYYSQDGLQGAYMAAAVISGVQSKGMYCYVKHYAVNDQEQDRGTVGTFLSEQAMREIYVKSFEYAVKFGHATGAMTAMNRIGGIKCFGNYRLNTTLLRDEWGFKGAVITDAGSSVKGNMLIRSGNDLPLATYGGQDTISGTWDPTLRNGNGSIRDGNAVDGVVPQSDTQYYFARTAATRLLWTAANSNNIENSFDQRPISTPLTGKAYKDAPYSTNAAVINAQQLGVTSVQYKCDDLPDGLTIDPNTGIISGVPTTVDKEGKKVILQYIVDKWIIVRRYVTITVDDSWTVTPSTKDGEIAKITYSKEVQDSIVGVHFAFNGLDSFGMMEVTYDAVYKSVKLQAVNLPEGVKMSEDGTISGTLPSGQGLDVVVNVIGIYDATAPCATAYNNAEKLIATATFHIGGDGEVGGYDDAAIKARIAELEAKLEELKNSGAAYDDTAIKAEIAELKAQLAEVETGGCGGVIGATSAVIAALAVLGGAGLVLRKKKED